MLTPQLSRQLAKHFQEQGRFSPFTYTIGLQSSFKESEDAMQPYPIPEPISEETISQFSRSLTFFHEAAHLCQFVSSAYGLRTLRYTLVCLRNLSRGKSWRLPIASSLLNRKDLSADEQRAYEGALIFLDGMDQLRLHQYVFLPSSTGPQGTLTVDYLPWTPHFFQLSDQTYEGREEFAKKLNSIGAHVRKLPRLTINAPSQSYLIALNVAALMESYAVLVEMSHIYNALELNFSESLGLLPTGNEYFALAAYVLQEEICSASALLLTLGVLIDASLMYDPFVLYNVPWDVVDKEGKHEQYPGETFITLCEAAKRTTPIREASEEDIARFYKELCHNAGLPDPDWMAQKSYEVAKTLLEKAPWEQTLLGRALKAHTDALKFRCDKGAAFPFLLPTTECIYELINLAVPAISFYRLSTRQPEGFDPRKIDTATIHSILLQAITQPTIQCPLKMGEPFFCNSALLPPNSLCVWQFGDETRECLLDLLERKFGFRSS